MTPKVIGLLHPGEMGAGVGACLRAVGYDVLWLPCGRSEATRHRAKTIGLRGVATIEDLVGNSDVVISIVPPHAALDVAKLAAPGSRLFLDANAVSPQTMHEMGDIITEAGGDLVDGGIVGPPPTAQGTTRLYLSGARASDVAALFEGSLLDTRELSGEPGAASALKMSYAAWTKGTDALLLGILALARHNGVEDALVSEWRASRPELIPRLHAAGRAAGRKGWRWLGEMEEIAASFSAAGLPGAFHEAAADVFARVPHDPDAARDDRTLNRIVKSLLDDHDEEAETA